MPNISDNFPEPKWITYELDTDILEPPRIKLKIRFVNMQKIADIIQRKALSKASEILEEIWCSCVEQWDLCQNDVLIPCTDENKRKFYGVLSNILIKERDDFLGTAVITLATDLNFFLKAKNTSH